jgi:hypothetical protein
MKVWTLTTENPNGDVTTAIATTEEQLLEAFGAALDGWVEDEVVDSLDDPAEAERIAREKAFFLTVEVAEHDLPIPDVRKEA